MKRDPSAPQLSAVFVDYDNIYLSLKRRNEEAARRFSKDAAVWLKALEKGSLITATEGFKADAPRRIVLNRCYGNPVPRRNQADNSTDMNSFPFVRHNFLRAGFEIVDCPPLTSQQKNAADIRMVMDLRDYLTHATYFDEFIILSGDADFTPVLHRLRQHARRTVIYSNDHTAAAYAAISDGDVREADLIALLSDMLPQLEVPQAAPAMAMQAPAQAVQSAPIVLQSVTQPRAPATQQATQLRLDDLRLMIMQEVVAGIRTASGPVPLEALADRSIRALGHERTVGTAWAGAGSFRELMRIALPNDLQLSDTPPYYAFDPARHALAAPAAPAPVLHNPSQQPTIAQQREALAAALSELTQGEPPAPVMRAAAKPEAPIHVEARAPVYNTLRPSNGPEPRHQELKHQQVPAAERAVAPQLPVQRPAAATARQGAAAPSQALAPRPDPAVAAQAMLARIQEACQAPALSAQDFRVAFQVLADEISENGLTGARTLAAVAERAAAQGTDLRREDVRFLLDVVTEPDPWLEQGGTPTLFAGRFRNFVVARCRDFGLQLSAAELDMIDRWLMGSAGQQPARGFASDAQRLPAAEPPRAVLPAPRAPIAIEPPAAASGRWWASDDGRQGAPEQPAQTAEAEHEFPRIVRARQRG